MKAVFADGGGGPEVLVVRDLPDPEPGPGEVVLEVAAAGLNRADLLQRQGFYPPPPGASDVLGMECSGTVAAVGAGGIGTFAIQLATQLGARVFTTAGSAEKREFCRSLGAEVAIDYRDEDFVEVLKAQTDGAGADVILDNMGASYLNRNVAALAIEGRLVIIGMQGGTKGELDINTLLRKRGAVIATAGRSRPAEEKAAICRSVVEHVWPLVADGKVRPIVHGTMPLDEVSKAHELMESGEHTGKILLTN